MLVMGTWGFFSGEGGGAALAAPAASTTPSAGAAAQPAALTAQPQPAAVAVASASAPASSPFTFIIRQSGLSEFIGCRSWAIGEDEDGRPLLAAVIGNRVVLYDLTGGEVRPLQELTGFPAAPNSIAFADFDGDKVNELWIGSAGFGSIYIYKMSLGYPLLYKTNPLWNPIAEIYTPDLDGDGFADVVARTTASQNNIIVFLRRESGLEKVWQSGVREGQVVHVAVGDLDGDGRHELVLAREQSYMALWQWYPSEEPAGSTPAGIPSLLGAALLESGEEGNALVAERPLRHYPSRDKGQLEKVWEWYPPAGVLQLVTLSPSEASAELVVTTKQQSVYHFVLTAGRDGRR
ncbi:MAG TPA: VCBS repeat-containing protein, partial [Firmicutes bacterium]|nr:VCBS repeat-containing protein [Bacillota bacterium]